MSWWRFGLFTLAGSLIWNTIFVYGGYLLGDNWHILEDAAGWLQYAVIALVLLAVLVFVIYKVRKIRRQRGAADTDAVDGDPS
jgi:membrane protein DedA with SNARE-associated domain